MLSRTVSLKYLLPLLVVAAILGGIVGGLVVYVATKDNGSGLMRGGIVKLGPPSSLSTNPFCVEAQHFCIVQLDHGIVALYTYDTHPYFRSEDCSRAVAARLRVHRPGDRSEDEGLVPFRLQRRHLPDQWRARVRPGGA